MLPAMRTSSSWRFPIYAGLVLAVMASAAGCDWGCGRSKSAAVPAPKRPADRDGDGKADLIVFRPSTAQWFTLPSGNNFTKGSPETFGASGDVPLSGDYDGDGRTDMAVYRATSGSATWQVLRSSNGSLVSSVLGASSDVPVPAD